MKLRVIDFETDGVPPDARICEVGHCDVRTYDNDPPEVGDPVSMLIHTGRPMPPDARAVHHIAEADLVDAMPVEKGLLALRHGEPSVFVAHHAAFEKQLFTGGETPWICTLKVARRLWPESPSHSNQCLRYYLNLALDGALAMPPHRAAPDAYVTAFILVEAIKLASIDQMIEWTSQPSLLPGAINFGKHKGTPWPQVDTGYLEWIGRQADMDEDVKFTAKHWLDRRRVDNR
jgi:exodeoxyribonuclease X